MDSETQLTAVGAMRRLRALHARGWSAESIELATGLPAKLIKTTIERTDKIKPAEIQATARVYDRLWDKPAPASSQPPARAAHWPPPMAWDDDLIDQPDARPEPGWKRGGEIKHRAADVAEDVAFVREHGGYRTAPVAEIALRLGYSQGAVEKALSRAAAYQADREAV